jgi:RNAse (barnase) inhibitor barstar
MTITIAFGNSVAQMNEIALEALLTQPENAGVFFVTAADFDAIEIASQHNQAFFCSIDLQHCHGKTALMDLLADALKFPPGFGKNWDALADYLSDLSWLMSDAFVICFANADQYRDENDDEFKTLIEILEETSTCWSEQHSPFWAFMALPDDEFEKMQAE